MLPHISETSTTRLIINNKLAKVTISTFLLSYLLPPILCASY